jgi:hypothetical protein
MATTKKFTVVGVSTYHSHTKVRWGNDLVARIKIFSKNGHTDVDLIELPQPMLKLDAARYYQAQKKGTLTPDVEFALQCCIEDRVVKSKKGAVKVTLGKAPAEKQPMTLAEIAARPKLQTA